MPNRKISYTVTLFLPEDATRDDVGEYILDAISSWKGQFPPSEPLFHLDYSKIKVKDNSTKVLYENE